MTIANSKYIYQAPCDIMWYQLQTWDYTSIPVKGEAPSVIEKKMLARKLEEISCWLHILHAINFPGKQI